MPQLVGAGSGGEGWGVGGTCASSPFFSLSHHNRPQRTRTHTHTHSYCYVCDAPAAECKSWAKHCSATHKSKHWQAERKRVKDAAAAKALAKVANANGGKGGSSGSGSDSAIKYFETTTKFTCEALLKACEQVSAHGHGCLSHLVLPNLTSSHST